MNTAIRLIIFKFLEEIVKLSDMVLDFSTLFKGFYFIAKHIYYLPNSLIENSTVYREKVTL